MLTPPFVEFCASTVQHQLHRPNLKHMFFNNVHSEFPKLSPYTNRITKLKVVIDLYKKRPSSVRITDRLGGSVLIDASYPKLPPKCSLCKEFGHFQLRCPEAIVQARPLQVNVTEPHQTLIQDSPPIPPLVTERVELKDKLPSLDRRSRSMPSFPTHSKEASNSLTSERVVRRPKPRSSSTPRDSGRNSVKPVTTSQFEEEEMLIKSAQELIRSRLSATIKDDPPFQKVLSKKARKKRRQELLSQSLSETRSEAATSPHDRAPSNSVTSGSFEQAPLGPVSNLNA